MGHRTRYVLGALCLGLTLALLPVLSGCSELHATQEFSYPPGSEPRGSDWEYLLTVDASTRTTHAEFSEKNVLITVADTDGDQLLEDELQFNCGLIDVEVVWDEFETIHVDLLAIAAEGAEDPYNQKLEERGPLPLARLRYEYDDSGEEFERVAGP
jgi:hypothetical protein